MATEAQVQANRANAQKSTGPRTPEGKAIVAQNAITHGLLARAGVIPGEDEHEFEAHREGLRKQLRPDAPLEEVLADRIVDLSWRLKRAARDQEAAYAALYEKYTEGRPQPQEPDAWQGALGRMIVEDFCGDAVLERLQRYERRIESSFYKALNELRQAVNPCPGAAGESQWDCRPRRSRAEQSCETKPMEEVSSLKCEVSSEESRAASPQSLPTSNFTRETAAQPPSCETKPISAGGPTRPASSPAGIPVPRRIGRMLRNDGAKQSQFRQGSQRGSPKFGAVSLPFQLQT